jgi:hypothetical protein
VLRRVEGEEHHPSLLGALGLAHSEPIVPAVADVELETALLPHDHPKWVKDALTVSQRAKELMARLKPVVVHILTFWDHRFRSLAIGDCRVEVDPSGSYRVD